MTHLPFWPLVGLAALGLVGGMLLAQPGPLPSREKPALGVASRPVAGQVMGDTAVTAHIEAAFAADTALSALAIQVETQNGEVQLSGFAPTEAVKRRAIDTAQATRGARTVRYAIVVRP